MAKTITGDHSGAKLMPWLKRRSTLGIVLLLVPFNPASAQTIPDTDMDLDALRAAVTTARDSAKPCVRGSCAQFSCKDAIALGSALDDARIAMAVMQQSLHDAFKRHVDKQGELNEEYSKNLERDEKVRWAFRWSKAFSNFGKLLLDAAAWAEFLDHMKEISDISELVEHGTFDDQMAIAWRLSNDMKGVAEHLIESINDLKTVYHESKIGYDEAALSKLDEADDKALTISSGVSDVIGGLADLRLKAAAYRAAQRTGQAWKMKRALARQALTSSYAGFGQAAGKVLLEVAETQQSKLLDELKDIAVVQKAINQNYASIVQDTNRISNRYAKAQELRYLAADVFFENNVCVAQCPDAPGLKVIPDTTRMSYGEVLKAYNAKLPLITSDINTAAKRFVAREGTQPQITVTPQVVAPGEVVAAQFSMAACKATEGAKVKLVDVSSLAVTDKSLGDAQSGSPGSIQFKAPGVQGDYAVRIVDPHSRVLASAKLSVLKPKGEGPGSSAKSETARSFGAHELGGHWACSTVHGGYYFKYTLDIAPAGPGKWHSTFTAGESDYPYSKKGTTAQSIIEAYGPNRFKSHAVGDDANPERKGPYEAHYTGAVDDSGLHWSVSWKTAQGYIANWTEDCVRQNLQVEKSQGSQSEKR